MAITPTAGYQIDPNNPNAVIKADSVAMPGSVASIQQSNQQPSIAFGAVNTSNPTPIPVSTVTSNQTPISVANPNANYFNNVASSAITGAALPPATTEPTPNTTSTSQNNQSAIPGLTSFSNLISKYLPSNFSLTAPTSVVDQYKQMQAENDIAGKTKEVNDLSAQLAEIKTKYDLTPIVMEKAAQGNITTDILNRASSARQRDYAIEALPVTAALNAAQGRLDSANKNIQTLIGLVQTDQENTYKYQSDLLSRAMEFATADQRTELQKRQEAIDSNKITLEQFNANKKLYVDAATSAGDYKTAGLIARATSMDEIAGLLGGVKATPDTQFIQINGHTVLVDKAGNKLKDFGVSSAPGTGVSNIMSDNERALMSQFRGEQIVKDYNNILGQKTVMDNYIQNGVGGPADLAMVYSFMKGLDPNSVVRETEYATAAKSGNIFAGAFAKYNGYFKENGGFLPANVKTEFQNLVNQKLKAQEVLYNNVAKQYTDIASRQGLNPSNVVIDYAQANKQVAHQTSSYDKYVNDINDQGVMTRSAWNTVTDKDGLLAYMKSLGVDLKISD